MLIADLNQNQIRFIVTATESTNNTNPTYVMKIHSTFTNKTLYLSLPDSTSPFPSRYDEFIVDTTELAELEEGQYSYQIDELVDGVVEKGVLKIINSNASAQELYKAITPDEADDDFIVYQ